MNNNDTKIDLGPATYSIAMIEFDLYIATLKGVRGELQDADFILNRVTESEKQNENFIDLVKEYAVPPYGRIQKYIKGLKSVRNKYIERTAAFLKNNPDKQFAFDAKLNILNGH